MSLHPHTIEPIPKQTQRVCQSAFPKGNLVMQLRDVLGSIYEDQQWVELFSTVGQPGFSPWRLALITVLQYLEDLTDRQAAQAVCGRMDWKYALSLELESPGIDASVLSEFRERLVRGGAEERLLESLLRICEARGWLSAGGTQRTDSTHVQGALRRLHRLEVIGETLRAALNSLAVVVPEWLAAVVSEDWFERYSVRVEDYRFPSSEAGQHDLGLLMGRDGHFLLAHLVTESGLTWLRQIPAVEVLRQVWVQQFYLDTAGEVHLRVAENSPPSSKLIHSPYESEARFARKRQTDWVGYKVHLTETCEMHVPHLIVQVTTTPATVNDGEMTDTIHQSLHQHGRTPQTHLVDTAYVDVEQLETSQTHYGIELLGPVLPDTSWQARHPEGLDSSTFEVDWERQSARCPAGHLSQRWQAGQDKRGSPTVEISFAAATCRVCPLRERCTRATTHGRTLTLKPQPAHNRLEEARATQTTPEFKKRYALRAGIEGTISQAVSAFGLRRCRYRGLRKSHLQHVITATAMNVCRLLRWLNDIPFAKTRISPFAKLLPSRP